MSFVSSSRVRYATLLSLALAGGLGAQQPAAPAVSMVGQKAPDFAITVANKDGVAPRQFRLSEHLGETVVLAFFFQARTRG